MEVKQYATKSTPVFLSGESHEQNSLAGYSPRGRKESDMTKRLTYTHTHTHTHNPEITEEIKRGNVKTPRNK